MFNKWITPLDFVLAPLYIIIVLFIASGMQRKRIEKNPIYKYFTYGLLVKIIGALGLCFIYVYYYKGGGDTIGYHEDGQMMVNLLLTSPLNFFKVLLTPTSRENFSYFTNDTGFPGYWPDPPAFNVVRFISLLEFLGFKCYLPTSVLMAVISFTGIWKLYLTFCECYPTLHKQFAVSILFIPSVAFWGSGLLKDAWTISAAGWYSYSFYKIFIKKEKLLPNIISISVAVVIILLVKPYIFVGLLPGSVLWMIWNQLLSIKSAFLRVIVGPFVGAIGVSVGFFLWSLTSSNLGDFGSVDSMVMKAWVSYDDLKSEHYHGNSFDLGSYDPTLTGLLSKFPIAALTGLFRPFIWEAKNPVMILSGLEDAVFLFLTLFFLLRRPGAFISSLFTNPLVLFSIVFGVFFAFSVAISTSNFGALVRLRIPAIPFFISGILLVEYLSREREKSRPAYGPKRVEYTR